VGFVLDTIAPEAMEDRDEKNRVRDRVKRTVIRPFVKVYLRYHPGGNSY
jgi:hypothetical protein